MKRLLNMSICCVAVFMLLSGMICRTDHWLLAAADNVSVPIVVKDHAPDTIQESPKKPKKAAAGDYEQSDRDEQLPKQVIQSNGYLPQAAPPSPISLDEEPSVPERKVKDSQSPFRHLFFLVYIAGLGGLVLIVAGIVQLRRNKKIKQIRLFPPKEISELPFPAVAAEDELLLEGGKRQAEAMQEERKSEQTAQRRAA